LCPPPLIDGGGLNTWVEAEGKVFFDAMGNPVRIDWNNFGIFNPNVKEQVGRILSLFLLLGLSTCFCSLLSFLFFGLLRRRFLLCFFLRSGISPKMFQSNRTGFGHGPSETLCLPPLPNGYHQWRGTNAIFTFIFITVLNASIQVSAWFDGLCCKQRSCSSGVFLANARSKVISICPVRLPCNYRGNAVETIDACSVIGFPNPKCRFRGSHPARRKQVLRIFLNCSR